MSHHGPHTLWRLLTYSPIGNVVVRDPAIRYNPVSKKYFVFSTGGLIKIFTSDSLRGRVSSSPVPRVVENQTLTRVDVQSMDGFWLRTHGLLQDQQDQQLQPLGARRERRRREVRHVLRRVDERLSQFLHRRGHEPDDGERDVGRPRASRQLEAG